MWKTIHEWFAVFEWSEEDQKCLEFLLKRDER